MITTSPILTFTDLAAGFCGRPVFSGLNLDISAGMICQLKGVNGSGKTTLLRCLAGLLPLLSGQIELMGRSPAADPVDAALRTIYIGHRDGLAAELTSKEAIHIWAVTRGLCPAEDDLRDGFSALEITSVMDQPIRTLSQGQQRRVSMVRLALMTRLGRTKETPLWLLDEPTTAMDSAATASFTALISAHAKAGGAAVLATHHELEIKGAITYTLGASTPGGRIVS